MCGNWGIFHGRLFRDPRIGHYDPNHGNGPPVQDPQIAIDQQASISANEAAAAWRKRRLLSTLSTSPGVVGSPSLLGASASSPGGPGGAPGGRPGPPGKGGGSLLGAY